MCGIAGIVEFGREVWPDVDLVARMADAIAHRGPDDQGLMNWQGVVLGHRRLSIIDIGAGGHQPMTSHDRRHAIVLNGEIYNYLELRTDLQALGCHFNTASDTEVALEAYRVWGEDCVSRFNGMWALAIYDVDARKVFLSRDRLGIKPLYYAERAGRFLFCSEIKGLLAVDPGLRQVNLDALIDFIPSGSLDESEDSLFVGVKSLPAGSNLSLDVVTGRCRRNVYWRALAGHTYGVGDSARAVEDLAELLESAVRLQLRSDVPVGTCLSGGVDSSTLAAIACMANRTPMHTFSGLYPDADCDESRYVELVNRHVHAIPHGIRPDPRGDLADWLATITWHQDEPTAGPGLLTQFQVMKHASQHVKVLLDGQGADELFAGYLPYYAIRIRDLLESHSGFGTTEATILSLTVIRHWGFGQMSGVAESVPGGRAVRALLRMARGRFLAGGPTQGVPVLHDRLVERQRRLAIAPAPVASWGETRLSRVLHAHLVRQSIPALLHYEDRNSMAFGVEARVPYLDHRIVEFALGLPDALKLRRTWTKWPLRKVAERVLPDKVAWRRSKFGYPTPFARWLREPESGESIRELLFGGSLERRELVPADSVRAWWSQHLSGARDHSWLLYRLASIELWYRHFIDAWDPRPASVPAAARSG